MALARSGNPDPPTVPALSGPARVDARTKQLVGRLQVGDVAVIDHEDLDRVAAETLVRRRPIAVVNASRSLSGRYPALGALVLARAGIPLIDNMGTEVMAILDGRPLRLEGSDLWCEGELLASGRRQTKALLEAEYERARESLGAELERFAENTLEHLRSEHTLFSEELDVPPLKTPFEGRHVLIVVRGNDTAVDLAHLRSYVREIRPVLVGVDGGADALAEQGLKADIIIGDFDSVSEAVLRSGAELVVHAYADGRAPGAERLEALGLPFHTFGAPGTSEDIAMLMADDLGAELIVAVGTHASMVEFLDKGRAGMSSTFLTRLKVGSKLVDAKGVSRLYASRIRKRDLAFFLAAVAIAFVMIAVFFYPARVYLRGTWFIISRWWDRFL